MKVTLACICLVVKLHVILAFDGDLVGLLNFDPETKKTATQYLNECYKSEGATQQDLAELNEKSGCLLRCYFSKLKIFNEDGTYNTERLKPLVTKENFNVGMKCVQEKRSSDLCENPRELLVCYLKNYTHND